VVRRIAGTHERLVLGLDRGHWAEHQMRPDLVAVHILKPQLRVSGAQFAGVLDPAAVVGGVDRLRSAEADPLAAPHAPGLAVCDPQGRALLLIDDLRRAVAPTAGHAPLPQIGGQHVEIEMVVARDEDGFGHDTLRKRSFQTDGSRAGWPQWKRAPLAERPSRFSVESRSAAGDLAVYLAPEQCARGGAEQGAGGTLPAGVDCPAGESPGCGTDDQAGGAVRLAAVIAAIVAAPVAHAVVGGVIAAVRILRALAMGGSPAWRIGQGWCSGG